MVQSPTKGNPFERIEDLFLRIFGAQTVSDSSGTIAIDWNLGASVYTEVTSTGRTVTFANPVEGVVYRIRLLQGSGGSKTITTWPTIKWAGGSAPTLTTTAGQTDIVTLWYVNAIYYGDCRLNF